MGAAPDDPPEVVRSKALEKLRIKVFNQHMRRTRAFWNLPIIHGLGCAGHGIVLIYATYIAYDRGISYVAALLILSIISICSIASRFVTPVLAERFGGKPVMATALFLQGITVLVLFWAQDMWMFYLFAMVFGVGFGGEMSAYLVVNRQYFGSGPIATCYGFQTMGALTGHAIATGLAGLVLYVTNSYSCNPRPVYALQLRRSAGYNDHGIHLSRADSQLGGVLAYRGPVCWGGAGRIGPPLRRIVVACRRPFRTQIL